MFYDENMQKFEKFSFFDSRIFFSEATFCKFNLKIVFSVLKNLYTLLHFTFCFSDKII